MYVCVCVCVCVCVIHSRMSLSPWDLGAEISFDFSLYRPRRDSYVYATRATRRRRNVSYRRATKQPSVTSPVTSHDNTSSGLQATGSSLGGDGEDVERLQLPPLRKKRAHSYRAAVRLSTGVEELSATEEGLDLPADDKCLEDRQAVDDEGSKTPPLSPSPSGIATPLIGRYRSTKNVLVLSIGFVFIFSAFRALQNLETSVYQGRVGALVLTLVHGLALITGLLGPLVVSRVGPRWSLVLAALIYPVWIASNLCVTGGVFFYLILLTSSALVGVAQSIAWSAQVCGTTLISQQIFQLLLLLPYYMFYLISI